MRRSHFFRILLLLISITFSPFSAATSERAAAAILRHELAPRSPQSEQPQPEQHNPETSPASIQLSPLPQHPPPESGCWYKKDPDSKTLSVVTLELDLAQFPNSCTYQVVQALRETCKRSMHRGTRLPKKRVIGSFCWIEMKVKANQVQCVEDWLGCINLDASKKVECVCCASSPACPLGREFADSM